MHVSIAALRVGDKTECGTVRLRKLEWSNFNRTVTVRIWFDGVAQPLFATGPVFGPFNSAHRWPAIEVTELQRCPQCGSPEECEHDTLVRTGK